ncbi:creatinine amidohydrolase/Fe(II)-dependent formamide hydrolase-like protein [Bradyrhizobium yuanmingense]
MLWTGLSQHHMSFGGTFTLDFQTLFNMIRCVCESVVRHGFRRIVLLNGHGGNENALRVCAELSPKLGGPIVQFASGRNDCRAAQAAEQCLACLRGRDVHVHGVAA